MQRIATATKYADLFGAGKHGFGENPVLPISTQLSAGWFNSLQEEIARVVEDQGYALNAANYEQLLTALHSFQFAGLAAIASGGSFEFKAGSEAYVDPAAIFTFGGIPEFQGGAVFSTAGTLQLNAAVTLLAQGPATFTQLIGADGGISIAAGQTIYGDDATTTIEGFGYIESAIFVTTALGRVETRRLQFTAAATPAADYLVKESSGELNWSQKTVHRSTYGFLEPKYGYLAGPTAAYGGTIDDAGLQVSISLRPNQTVRVHASCWGEATDATADVNVRINVKDSGNTGDHILSSIGIAVPEANKYYKGDYIFHWKPSNNFGGALDPDTYTFRLRYGRSGGAGTVDIQQMSIKLEPIDAG